MDRIQRFLRLIKWSLIVALGVVMLISIPVAKAMVRSAFIIIVLAVVGLFSYLLYRKNKPGKRR